eukprot:g2514.t1
MRYAGRLCMGGALIWTLMCTIRRRCKMEERRIKKSTRPRISEEEIFHVLFRHFDIERKSVARIASLDSYDDLNFLVELRSGVKYVFKVFSSRRGGPQMVVMENEAMRHLQNRSKRGGEISTPRVLIPSEKSRTAGLLAEAGVVEYVSRTEGVAYYVRLLTFLPGTLWGDATGAKTSRLREDLGACLGKMDRALEDFDHPAAHREWEWDLSQAVTEGERYARYIASEQDRAVAKRALRDYETYGLSKHKDLRWRVVHSDANDYNICIDPSAQRVTGIFDFGDMVYTPLVHNVAIACAYASMGCSAPLDAARNVVVGYHRHMPLRRDELEILLVCVRARLAHSVCKSAYSRSLEPDNAYVGVSEANAWELLKAFEKIGTRRARDAFVAIGAAIEEEAK